MARMECICGETLSTTSAPNDVQLWVYTDKEMDTILTPDTIVSWQFSLPTYDVWRCPKCETIYVFKDGCDRAIKIYKLEK